MTNKFKENFASMALREVDNDVYEYIDSLSCVRYKQLETKFDGIEVPLLGVFTKPLGDGFEFTYQSVVSQQYKFEGNDVVVNTIKNSLEETAVPLFQEFTMLNSSLTSMSREIIIRNNSQIQQVGDVYPQISIQNTYDGTGAKSIKFGLSIYSDGIRISSFNWKTEIMRMRQIHMHSANTTAISVSQYVDTFTQNIGELIQNNMNNQVTEEQLMKTLDLIESIGKKKRVELSELIHSERGESPHLTSWNIFMAITKYSIAEQNINTKSLLENVVERVLVLPARMTQVLNNR